MQTPKEPTRLNILAASKEEFLEHGFEKASMRRISQIAGVSTSNIYNYFENKEGILTVLVQPILDGIDKGISYISEDNHIEKRLEFRFEVLQKRFKVALEYVDKNRDLFKLLMFRSSGSHLENSLDHLINEVTQLNIRQLHYFKKSRNLEIEFNEFFVRSLISLFVNVFVEMVKNNVSIEEIEKIEDQILKFLHYGSRAILLDMKD